VPPIAGAQDVTGSNYILGDKRSYVCSGYLAATPAELQALSAWIARRHQQMRAAERRIFANVNTYSFLQLAS
jgi:hypothetical protein